MKDLKVALYDKDGNFVRFIEYGGVSLPPKMPTAQSPVNAVRDDGMGMEQDRAASQFGRNFDSHSENKGSFQSEINELTTAGAVGGIDWSKYPNFSESEFACNCGCGQTKINEEIVMVLQAMRDMYGKPIRLNSAYRCLNYNRSIGSKDTSSHVRGKAVDILTPTLRDRFALVNIAMQCGIKRIGIYKNSFIHIDVDNEKAQNVIWLG
jgi:hypothetical protein